MLFTKAMYSNHNRQPLQQYCKLIIKMMSYRTLGFFSSKNVQRQCLFMKQNIQDV